MEGLMEAANTLIVNIWLWVNPWLLEFPTKVHELVGATWLVGGPVVVGALVVLGAGVSKKWRHRLVGVSGLVLAFLLPLIWAVSLAPRPSAVVGAALGLCCGLTYAGLWFAIRNPWLTGGYEFHWR